MTLSNRDKVRLKIGDNDPTDPLLYDEELDAFLDLHSITDTTGTEYDLNGAAAEAASAIAAKYARGYNFSIDGQSFNRSERVAHYLSLAKEIRSRMGGSSIPLISSVTTAIQDDITGGE